jgi:hypothetical protein
MPKIIKYYFIIFSGKKKPLKIILFLVIFLLKIKFLIFGGSSWPSKIRKPSKLVYIRRLLLAVENNLFLTVFIFGTYFSVAGHKK